MVSNFAQLLKQKLMQKNLKRNKKNLNKMHTKKIMKLHAIFALKRNQFANHMKKKKLQEILSIVLAVIIK